MFQSTYNAAIRKELLQAKGSTALTAEGLGGSPGWLLRGKQFEVH